MQHSEVTGIMGTVGFTKKYTSLSDAKGVNPLAEVTNIHDQKFETVQHGQRWHSRLACWIKDSTRSFFSPLRKNNPNKAWRELSRDLGKDTTISEESKDLAQRRIVRWQKGGVPLRKLHVMRLLRQLDESFASQQNMDPQVPNLTGDGDQIHVGIDDPVHETLDSSQTGNLSQKTLDSSQTGSTNLETRDFSQTESTNLETRDFSQTENTEKLSTSWQHHSLKAVPKDIKGSRSLDDAKKSVMNLEAPIQTEPKAELEPENPSTETNESKGSVWDDLLIKDEPDTRSESEIFQTSPEVQEASSEHQSPLPTGSTNLETQDSHQTEVANLRSRSQTGGTVKQRKDLQSFRRSQSFNTSVKSDTDPKAPIQTETHSVKSDTDPEAPIQTETHSVKSDTDPEAPIQTETRTKEEEFYDALNSSLNSQDEPEIPQSDELEVSQSDEPEIPQSDETEFFQSIENIDLTEAVQKGDGTAKLKADLEDAMKSIEQPTFQTPPPAPKSETPKLDEVANTFVTKDHEWVTPHIYEAVVDLFNKKGIVPTAEFRQADNEGKAHNNRMDVAGAVMTRFFRNTDGKEPGLVKKSAHLSVDEFKLNFEKAFLEITSEKTNWFEVADTELVDGNWDTAALTDKQLLTKT